LADIFLSYGHTDAAIAKRFAAAFERAGLSVWWDATLHSGDSFDAAIEAALRGARAVVVLWSAASVQSRWVRAEATLADRLKTLLPVMIENCERPIMFELTHTPSLVHWSGDDEDGVWRSVIADVRRLVDRGGEATGDAPAPLATRAAMPERGGEPGVGMLPILSRSGLPEDEVFAEDLLPEILAELSRHGYCRVITTAAIAGARGNQADLRALARTLEVRYLVESHIRRVGPNLRLMIQLTEGANGNILWSQKYERPLAAVEQLQDELAVEIASHIGEQVLRLEFEHVYRKSENLTAWERALRSMACMGRINSQSMRLSIEEARQALRIAPDYAFAHAQLAVPLACYGVMLRNGDETETAAEVRLHVRRAVELAPTDSRVLQFAANACSVIGDFQACLRYSERAVELTPNVAHAHQGLGCAYLGLGRIEEALREFDAEERLAPHDGIRYLSWCMRGVAYLVQNRLDAADAALERSRKLNPSYHYALIWKAVVASLLGRDEEAVQLVREVRTLEPHITLAQHQANSSVWVADAQRARELNAVLRTPWAATDS